MGAGRKRLCIFVYPCISLPLTHSYVELSSCQSTLGSFSVQFWFCISTTLPAPAFPRKKVGLKKIIHLNVRIIS